MVERLEMILLPRTSSVREAMQAIDRGSVEIALVVDSDRRLLGTVTDGDLRRAFLSGSNLESPVLEHMSRQPYTVGPDAGRAEVLDLMSALRIQQVPIVNDAGIVQGVHVLHELIGHRSRPNWGVIMAGGKGQRLAPLTDTIPKPMLRVAGRPILERLVLHLVGCGICKIAISINHLGHMIEDHFGDGSRFGCRIEYLREDEPLGTGGSLRLLADLEPDVDHPIMAMNGDLVTELDIGELIDAHTASGTVATVAATQYTHRVPFGVLVQDGDGLAAFDEKPLASWHVAAGIYVIEPRLIGHIPPNTLFPLPRLIVEAIERGERVGVWHSDHAWSDVGQPNDLLQARGLL